LLNQSQRQPGTAARGIFCFNILNMKTLKEVKKQITDNLSEMNECVKISKCFEGNYAKKINAERKYKKLSNENELLRKIQMYLEHSPSEKSLQETSLRLKRIIKSKTDQYEYWFHNARPDEVEPKKARYFFNKENGITHLRRQIKTLNIILGQK